MSRRRHKAVICACRAVVSVTIQGFPLQFSFALAGFFSNPARVKKVDPFSVVPERAARGRAWAFPAILGNVRTRASRLDMLARRGMFASLVGFVAISSCTPKSSNNYAGAAIGAAVAVATVATMRAVTGECWARCDQGQVCDRESGLCVYGECYPACGWGQHCERFSGGLLCVPDPNASLVTLPVQATPTPSAVPTTAPSTAAPPEPVAPVSPAPPATAPSTLDPSWTEEPAEPPAPEPAPPPWESGGAAEPAPGNWATPKD
jgi:hypothetical protein